MGARSLWLRMASLLQTTPAPEDGGPLQDPYMYTCTKCARCAANIQNNPNLVCSSTLHTSPKSEWIQRDHRTQNKCCGDASARSPTKKKPRALLRLFPVLPRRCKCAVSREKQTMSTILPVPSTASDINPTFLSRLTECSPPPGLTPGKIVTAKCGSLPGKMETIHHRPRTHSFSPLFKGDNSNKILDFRKKIIK